MIEGVANTHAKAILVGEHAVVYGKPAIAFPVHSLRLKAVAKLSPGTSVLRTPFHEGEVSTEATGDEPLEQLLAETALRNVLKRLDWLDAQIDVTVSGFIPPARGLGSSAAVAGAIIKAVASLKSIVLTPEELFDLVQSVERVAHGTPSGLDAYATQSNEAVWFERGKAKPLKTSANPALIIADTGVRGHTSQAVSMVRKKYEQNQTKVEGLFDRVEQLAEQAGKALQQADFLTLGDVMNKNQEILQELGVSSPELEKLIAAARNSGAIGAKLTGGGLGGCMLALARDEQSFDELKRGLLSAGAKDVWVVNDRARVIA